MIGDISAVLSEGSLYKLAAEVFPGKTGKLLSKLSRLNNKFERLNKNWNDFMAEILEEHKKKMAKTEEDEGQEEDFVDILLREMKNRTAGFDLTENDLMAIVRVDLFFLYREILSLI